MRIVVLSDSHGREDRVRRVLEQEQPDWALFLGDGLRDWEHAVQGLPPERCLAVKGNCDWNGDAPAAREETLGGHRFFMTHGHMYGVKYDLYTLACAARERQAKMVLFGHTHQKLDTYEDGLYLFNPGSLGYDGTYGRLEVTSRGILPQILTL